MSMSSLELRITNPPTKFVRARYKAEDRGFIHGQNKKDMMLVIEGKTLTNCDLIGAKCVGEVKSVSTKQDHGFYKLYCNEWDIPKVTNGIAKVNLHRLAVLNKSIRSCPEEHKSDRGKFFLEFKLVFADGSIGPTCRTDNMLDQSCKETCIPKIKSVHPKCAVGGEEVWIQCVNDVAKTNLVEAHFSCMLNGQECHFPVKCQVEGKLVKFVLPSLYDNIQIDNVVKSQLRLVVDKNDDIKSNMVSFGYLPADFRRPNTGCSDFKEGLTENTARKRKVDYDSGRSKTFDSVGIMEWSSSVEDIVEGSECMFNCGNSEQSKAFQNCPKAFQELKNYSTDEKIKASTNSPTCTPHEVILQTRNCTKTIHDQVSCPGQNQGMSETSMIKPQKQQLDKGVSHQEDFINDVDGVSPQCLEESNTVLPSIRDWDECLPGKEQKLVTVNNSSPATKLKSKDPWLCHSSSFPNMASLHQYEDQPFSPTCISVYHWKDPPASSSGGVYSLGDYEQNPPLAAAPRDAITQPLDLFDSLHIEQNQNGFYWGCNELQTQYPCSGSWEQPMEKVMKLS